MSEPARKPAPQRTTGQHPRECRSCNGWGYTRATGTVMSQDRKTTLELGYGCVPCRGTGRV